MEVLKNISIELTPELRMEQALLDAGVENPALIGKLTVSGAMLNDDFIYLGEVMGETLKELDLEDAFIEEDGLSLDVFDELVVLSSLVLPNSYKEVPWGLFPVAKNLTSVTISGRSMHALFVEALFSGDDEDNGDDFDFDDDDFEFDGDDDDDFDFDDDDFNFDDYDFDDDNDDDGKS